MDFAQIISENAVDLACSAATKDDVLRHMAQMLLEDHAITSVEDFLQNVYEREAEGITGIGDGIAIPHGKSDAVIKNCVAVCKLENEVAWQSIDDKPVTFVILFAVMKDAPSAVHLKMIAGVAAALADASVCQGIKSAQTASELIQAFSCQTADAK